MPTKLHVNAALGIIEIEGDEKVVLQIYGDLKELIKSKIASAEVADRPDAEPATITSRKSASKTKPVKKGGPSCASRIVDLKTAKFFTNLREGKAVGDALAAKGHNYQSNQIAASLMNMTKRGELRRVKKDGSWFYQNP